MARPRELADVVVVGAGLAGTTAALRSAEAGCSVVLAEKSAVEPPDGNTAMSVGGFHAVFRSLEADPAELAAAVVAATDSCAREDVVRSFAESCRPAWEWFRAKGFATECVGKNPTEFLPPLRPFVRADDWPGSGIATALASMQDAFAAAGGRLWRDSRAVELIRSPLDGAVAGVTVEREGRRVDAAAGKVVLADGGFQGNAALLVAYVGPFADRLLLRGGRGATGDGLRMGLAIGAAAVGLQNFYGHLLHREALRDDRLWPYPMLDELTAEGILVDARGARIADEAMGGVGLANAIARGPDPRGAWVVIGEEAFVRLGAQGPFGFSLPAPCDLEARGATVLRATTIPELAAAAGMSEVVLAATVEAYDAAVDAGALAGLPLPRTDAAPPLEPPYVAIPAVPGITSTMGGLAVDGAMRVLDLDDRPIPGLFAAGAAAGGLSGGPRGGYVGGLAPALAQGFVAGSR